MEHALVLMIILFCFSICFIIGQWQRKNELKDYIKFLEKEISTKETVDE
jgi:hypothetical protein